MIMIMKNVVSFSCCELLSESENEGWFEEDFVCH
jgi:hypothetical protein